jgi:hypothetical protein
MKHKLKTTIASLILSFSAPSWAGTKDTVPPQVSPLNEVSTQVTAGYATDYIWRGVKSGKNLFEGSLQFGLNLDDSTAIALGVFGAGTEDFDRTEVEFTAGVAHDFGLVTGTAEYTYYNYSAAVAANTQELALGVVYVLPFDIESTLKYFISIEGDNNGYSEFTLSKTLVINESQYLTGTVTEGFLIEAGEFAHTTADLSYNYRFSSGVTASPFVSYSFGHEGVRDTDAGFAAGVKASFKF